MPPIILVTGSNGFIGRHLITTLRRCGIEFASLEHRAFIKNHTLPNYEINTVVHLAGRAHIPQEASQDSYKAFYEANCEYALSVARAASDKGLKRFVYISSAGVYGKSSAKSVIGEGATLEPVDDYGTSKLEAENKLKELSSELGFELVIVRPALVYGYDSPGNVERLLKLTGKLPFIPISEKNNSRSFIYIDNLVDFILLISEHPEAAGKIFNIADVPISTYELIDNFAKGMGRKPLLFTLPRFAWKSLLTLMGKRKLYEQLFEDLVMSTSLAEQELGWKQKYGTSESLQRTGKEYIQASIRTRVS